jgi:hypothetical protein
MNKKLKDFIDKQAEKKERQRVWDILSTAEKKDVVLLTWHDHVMARDEIANFITIVGDKMYPVFPNESQVILPFDEYYGDHSENWIIIWDLVEEKELFRKNVKGVDLVDWVVKKPEEKIDSCSCEKPWPVSGNCKLCGKIVKPLK